MTYKVKVDGGMRSRRGEANPGGDFKSRAPAFARRLWSPLDRETKTKTVVEHDPSVSKEMCCESSRGLKNRGKG